MFLGHLGRIAVVISLTAPLAVSSTSAALLSNQDRAPTTHHVYIVGDSLTFGAKHFASLTRRVATTRKWTSTIVNAKPGRSISQGIEVIKKAKLRNPTAIVVALGTNDLLSQRSPSYPAIAIDRFMKAANGRPVLWLNIEFSTTRPDWRSRGVRFNRELRKAKSRWPNLEIADWDKFFVSQKASRFVQDGIHLTVSGYRTRASFMVAQLNNWAALLVDQTTTTTTSSTVVPTSSTDSPASSTPEATTTTTISAP